MRMVNGFTKRPHVLQIASFILILYMNFEFGFFLFPLLHLYLKVLGMLLFYSSSIILIFLFLRTMWIDPTDPLVVFQREEKEKKREVNDDLSDYFCFYCQCYVHENSKHCKKCDRCVKDFDHHCVWLNNCIGGSNYRVFMTLISTVVFCNTIYLIFHAIAIIEYAQDGEKAFDLNSENFSKDKLNIFMIFLWSSGALSLLILVFVLNLFIFHIWLIRNHITTYDYIINRRGKADKKKKHLIPMKNTQPQTEQISDQNNEKLFNDTVPFPSPDPKERKMSDEKEIKFERKQIPFCRFLLQKIKSLFQKSKRLIQITPEPISQANMLRDNTNDSSPAYATPEKNDPKSFRDLLLENGKCQTDQKDVALNTLFDRSSTRNEYVNKNVPPQEGFSSTELIGECPRNFKRNLSLDYISESTTQPDLQALKVMTSKNLYNSFDQAAQPKMNLKIPKKKQKKLKQQHVVVVNTGEKTIINEKK